MRTQLTGLKSLTDRQKQTILDVLRVSKYTSAEKKHVQGVQKELSRCIKCKSTWYMFWNIPMILTNVWMYKVSLKIYELVLFKTIFVQLFWSSLCSFFCFFLVEGYLLPLIFKLIEKWNILNFGSQFRSISRILPNIQDGGFYKNSELLSAFDYYCRKRYLRYLAKLWVSLWSQ